MTVYQVRAVTRDRIASRVYMSLGSLEGSKDPYQERLNLP